MRRFLFVPLALVLARPTPAQTHRRTVLDYFKMLPSKRFFEVEDQVPRMKWLREGFASRTAADNRTIVDLKNDFLRYPGGDGQGRLDVAVFRFKGQDTVAALYNYEGTNLSFWRPQNGRLVEVTKQVFPFSLRGTVTHVLPRRGTTIRVLKGGWPNQPTKTILARFEWRGGRFVRA